VSLVGGRVVLEVIGGGLEEGIGGSNLRRRVHFFYTNNAGTKC
jgi:hypothetical protein